MPPFSPAPPHPLAARLITYLYDRPATILEIGTGSGRNTRALQTASLCVVSIADPDVIPSIVRSTKSRDSRPTFDAILTTHRLLHGYPDDIHNLVHAIAEKLEPGGMLFATFGSQSDARFGTGKQLAETTFAPLDGDERDVAHSYFNEAALRELLEPHFVIERIEEVDVDAIAGRWAHAQKPLSRAVHWFIEARRR